ncbi:hypothetical protein EV715DRAFT_249156 [Schizophyllum commune]
MAWLPLLRVVSLTGAVVSGIIALGISAHLLNFTTYWYGFYYTFTALTIASAALTMVTLPVMLLLDRFRTGAFTSMIAFEVVWLFVLWVLWIASAGLASDSIAKEFPDGCHSYWTDINTACREFSAITAFDYITWFFLSAYLWSVFAIAIRSAQGGKSIWRSSVKEEYGAGGAVASEKQTYPTTAYAPAATQPPVSQGYSTPQPAYNTPQPAQGTYGNAPAQYPPQGAAQV